MRRTHSDDKRRMNHKRLAMLLSMILVITCTVGGTLAYLFTRTESITDTFEPANVSCTISNDQASVTNASETSVWLRVSITAVYRSTDPEKQNSIHWENPVITVTPGDNWEKFGDFYYYKNSVDAGGAVDLPGIDVSGSVDGFRIEKQILAEVIQSAPLIAVQEAWGMTRVGDTWEAYTPAPDA